MRNKTAGFAPTVVNLNELVCQAEQLLNNDGLVKGEDKVWKAIYDYIEGREEVLDNYRFGEHIKVLGRVRLLAHRDEFGY